MNFPIKTILLTLIITLTMFIQHGCRKDVIKSISSTDFILSSPAIGKDSLLPIDYTCEGSNASPPLHWRSVPSGTVSLALIMHHEASPTDIHCYWIIYNLSPDVDSISRNSTGTGTPGINSVNNKMQYTPPCSQGPGLRDYTFTLYALSQKPVIPVAPDSVNRLVMLNAIKNITISSTKMTVYYVWGEEK